MSVIEYRNLLFKFSEEIDWQAKRRWLMFILKDFLPEGSEDDITDIISLFTKLEEKNLLGIDRLHLLKDLLKRIEKWDLLRTVEQLEITRKDYRQLLEQITHALGESSELQRLISICGRQNLIAHGREEFIISVNSLFTELEQQNNLGVGNLTILNIIATEIEKPDLCRLLREFDEKRKLEEDTERERKEREDRKRRGRAQAAAVLAAGINVGERLIGVVTPHCTFYNLSGVAVVVTTWMVLRRSRNLEAFVSAFKDAVLPLGNYLRAVGDGSIRFTIQAESTSALKLLWQNYQDKTLQKKLQEFLVTEEIKQLAGGEVTLTALIDEEEYRNAMFYLMTSEREDLFPVNELMPSDRKVEEYLENIHETDSSITHSSDSGEGTWSGALSEYGIDKGDALERLNRLEDSVKDAIEHWTSFYDVFKEVVPSEDDLDEKVRQMREEMERIMTSVDFLKDSEKLWMNAESLWTSSNSSEAILQKLRNSLWLGQDFFGHPTAENKKAIRGLARKAKSLERIDVFELLREITPPGTTGPRLPDDLDVKKITGDKEYQFPYSLAGENKKWDPIKQLDLRPIDTDNFLKGANLLDIVIMRHKLITVGELYDFLCDHELARVADNL